MFYDLNDSRCFKPRVRHDYNIIMTSVFDKKRNLYGIISSNRITFQLNQIYPSKILLNELYSNRIEYRTPKPLFYGFYN